MNFISVKHIELVTCKCLQENTIAFQIRPSASDRVDNIAHMGNIKYVKAD